MYFYDIVVYLCFDESFMEHKKRYNIVRVNIGG